MSLNKAAPQNKAATKKTWAERFKFLKTIRFKLTLLYSMFLFLFSTILVVGLNMYLNSYLTNDPIFHAPNEIEGQLQQNGTQITISFNQLQDAERMHIREVRLDDLKQIQGLSLLALFPIALISFILGYIITGRFLHPITELRNQFENLETRDLGKTMPVNVDDEVGNLINSFNKLSLRLKTAFTTQEQFVQDASHELKTPLTVIQTNLDTVVDDPKANRAELQLAIQNALKGMKNVRKLTENLLQLSEPENFSLEKIELRGLLEQQLDQLQVPAKEHKVALKAELGKEDIYILGDEMSLGRACANLIENGIKYSAGVKDAEVKVSLTIDSKDSKNAKNVIISISDNGPGIPEEAQGKIFDRFYRVDKSRSRASGGFGLGLPIAKKIVKEHRGKISLESKPGQTVFRITLPLQKPD